MSIKIYPVTETFAAEIGDSDLSHPLSDADMQMVREAFARYVVLIFPSQNLTVEQHLAFAANFGPLERTIEIAIGRTRLRTPPEIADVANLNFDGSVWREDARRRQYGMLGNRLWHTDSSFKAPSGYASLLYSRSIPPVGGHTEFADLRAAWDALPEATKQRVRGLVADHSLIYSRARIGFTNYSETEKKALTPVAHPMVRRQIQPARCHRFGWNDGPLSTLPVAPATFRTHCETLPMPAWNHIDM